MRAGVRLRAMTAETAPAVDAGLASRAVQGAKITVSMQGVRFLIQFAGLVVLGRLLSPADFGLIAMVTAIVGIGEVLRDFGLSTAAIQSRKLSHAQASNLFWINSSIGLLLALVCAALSLPLASLYDEPRVAGLSVVLAVNFLINGMQAQFQAQLVRDMRYWRLTVTDVLAQGVGLCAGVGSALLGLGYWSIAVQAVVQAGTLLLGRWLASSWRPGLPNRSGHVGELFSFGRNVVGTQLLVYLSSNIDSVVIGRSFGPVQLGFYQRAFQLLMMPLNQILSPLNNVALPVLAQLQDDPREFSRFILRAQTSVLYPVVILFTVVGVTADWVIPLVFGEQWEPSVRIFQILAVGGVFQSANYVSYWIFLSLGRTASHLRYSLVSRTVLILSLVIGSQWGLSGVAVGYSLTMVISWPLALWWMRGFDHVRPIALLLRGARALIFGGGLVGAGVVATALVAQHLPRVPAIAVTVLAMAMAGVLLYMFVRVLRTDLSELGELFSRRLANYRGQR